MKKTIKGLLFGAVAGIIDVIPMVLQGLPWNVNLSTLAHWTIVGFFIATTQLPLKRVFKGITIASITLIPTAIMISPRSMYRIFPIGIMTVILGGILGYTINKHKK